MGKYLDLLMRQTKTSRELQALITSLSTSVLGYSLLENPRGFVLAVIYDTAVNSVITGAGWVGAQIQMLWGLFTDATVGAVGAALGPPARGIVDLVESILFGIEGLVVTIANAAGPLAPLVVVLVWAFVALGVVALITGAWRLYKWIRTVVV